MEQRMPGLLRGMPFPQRGEVEEKFEEIFDELNAAADEIRLRLYDLRRALDDILYAE